MSARVSDRLLLAMMLAATLGGAMHAIAGPLVFPDSADIHRAVGFAEGPLAILGLACWRLVGIYRKKTPA